MDQLMQVLMTIVTVGVILCAIELSLQKPCCPFCERPRTSKDATGDIVASKVEWRCRYCKKFWT